MVLLIFLFQVLKYLQCFLRCGWLHHNLLKAPLQCPVFFDGFAILVSSCGTDALQLATREGWFEHVGGIHGTGGRTCAYDGVDFVNEENDFGVGGQFFHHALHTFFKLSAIFGAGHHCRHIQRHNLFVEQNHRHLALHNTLCQSFNYGCFAYTWLSQQNGVVLLAPAQDLGDAFYFFRPSNYGIEFAVAGILGEVHAIFVEKRRVVALKPLRFVLSPGLGAAGCFAFFLFIKVVVFETEAVGHFVAAWCEMHQDGLIVDAFFAKYLRCRAAFLP